MALRIRFQYPSGATLGYSIERLSDGTYYDFATSGGTAGTFTASPATRITALPEDTGSFLGRYRATLASTPATQFTNGEYCVAVHNTAAANEVVGQLSVVMFAGDDAPNFAVPAVDPWGVILPGSYSPGTAGAILGMNLDAQVSTRSTYAGGDPWEATLPGSYSPGTAGAILGMNLDAQVSTRSTYAGGPVTSVTSPVTVSSNLDKSGYTLAPSGLDSVAIETGVHARQALSAILAAAAGVLSGAGSGTIVIRGGSVATTRITATTDPLGNRSSVTLALPA